MLGNNNMRNLKNMAGEGLSIMNMNMRERKRSKG